jgi:acyl-coenzyme A thioesterase PaaI-like protein
VTQPQPEGDAGAGLARGWLDNSPFVAHLGIELESMEPDRARLRLP